MKDLESESVNVGNTLRSQQINEEKSLKSHDLSCDKLEEIKIRLEEVSIIINQIYFIAENFANIFFAFSFCKKIIFQCHSAELY